MAVVSLMYHEIATLGESRHSYAVTEVDLKAQLEFLNRQSLTASVLDQDLLDESQAEDFVVITFDDGHLSDYSVALPLLCENDLRGFFFVTTGFLGREGYCVDQHVRELAGNGMVVGSHTHSHPFLDDLSEAEIREELRVSKSILEDIIQDEVLYFSCPGGRFSETVGVVAAELGYRGIFTSEPRSTVVRGVIPILGRFLIDSSVDLSMYSKIVCQSRSFVARKRLEEALKRTAKRLVGNRLYYGIWKKFKTRGVR